MCKRMIGTGIVILLIISYLIIGCGQTSRDITYTTKSDKALEIFLEGVDKLENLKTDEARALFGEAVKIDPEFAMAYYYWAVSSATTDDFQMRLNKAAELAEKASKPEQLVILSQKAAVSDSAGKARSMLEELVELLPESPRAHMYLGVFYYSQQEWSTAEKELKKVTVLDPNYAPAYNMLGYVYNNLGRPAEAIEALREYSKLRPDDPNPHDSMGEIYLAMGDHESSIKQYKQALQLEADFTFSMAGLGHNYVFMNEFDKAREAYSDMMKNAGSTADTNQAYFWKTVSFIHEGDYRRALEVQKEQLENAQSLTDIYAQALIHGRMASIYREMGEFNYALAEAANEKEIAMRPDIQPGVREGYIRDYLFTEAIVLARLGKRKQADDKLEQFKKSAAASKNLVAMKNYRGLAGVVAYWNKDYENAIQNLTEANPLSQYFKYYLGLSYLKTGQESEAHEIFEGIANFNRNSLDYAFVRREAEKLI